MTWPGSAVSPVGSATRRRSGVAITTTPETANKASIVATDAPVVERPGGRATAGLVTGRRGVVAVVAGVPATDGGSGATVVAAARSGSVGATTSGRVGAVSGGAALIVVAVVRVVVVAAS